MAFASLSDAQDRFTLSAGDGASLPIYGLGGPAAAPGLLVGHANGLAAGSYGPWLRELARHFRVFAFDARGHGGATWPAGPLEAVFAVDRFADDLAAVAHAVTARLAGAPPHFAGHSLAAAAALRLAARGTPLPFRRTILFEPPIFPPPGSPHFAEAEEKQQRLIRASARRASRWPSPEAFRAFLASRGVFQTFRRDLLDAHCRASLKPHAAGGFVLCCPPDVESAIFANHRVADTWHRLPQVQDAVHLVSGDPETADRDWVSACMAALARRLPRARLTVIRDSGHMMIFQQPDACRDLVAGTTD